ncbi:hypothetical protein [Thioalkalivibrio sp. XN279]|uniref:hypothetical protein n=1 Tax=Thioalkalivibrio sp. XN279 TaxID=2714953 RepID=UPI00140A8093|nr:hypothetical protein [Thioalkalivibrio sp. XN279]NHA14063.1 hypothetical protein [Thioalkalivibrio sp. XN279]
MQHAHTRHSQESHVEQKSQWHPFSWRRMNSRNMWILAGVAIAFILIGLAIV